MPALPRVAPTAFLMFFAAACGRSPASPTSTVSTESSFKLTAAQPAAPVDGAQVGNFDSFILTAANATVAAGSLGNAVIVQTFEVSDLPDFSNKLFVQSVLQGSGGTTSVPLTLSLPQSTIGSRVYWRVRAGAGEVLADYSSVFKLNIGPRQANRATLFADPPILVAPADGSLQAGLVTLVVANSRHSNGPTGYEIEVATTPGFAPPIEPCLATEYFGLSESSCRFSLRPGVYFWRAKKETSRNDSSLADGFHSGYSASSMFQVGAEAIREPIVVEPTPETVVSGRPTLVVLNASRTGLVGPMQYVFDVYAGDEGLGFGFLGSGTVTENPSGRTAWTVPFDLTVGLMYTWRAHGVDAGSGIGGPPSRARFTVVNRRATLLTLTIQPPPVVGVCGRSFSMAASTLDAFGASQFVVSTAGTLSIALARNSPVSWSGTIGGHSNLYNIRGLSSTNDPAPTTGFVTGDWSMSGMFDGLVTVPTSSEPVSCEMTGVSWTINRR